MSVAENDILHNNENIDRIKNDIAQFDVNADELVKRIADKEKEISELDADIIAKKKKYSELSEQLNEINTPSGKSSDVLQEITAELSVLTSKSADARVTEMTAESTVSELNSRIEFHLMTKRKRSPKNLPIFQKIMIIKSVLQKKKLNR